MFYETRRTEEEGEEQKMMMMMSVVVDLAVNQDNSAIVGYAIHVAVNILQE